MENSDYFYEKLGKFAEFLKTGSLDPGITEWGAKADLYLSHSKSNQGYCFEISQSDLQEICRELAVNTESSIDTWTTYFQKQSEADDIDLEKSPLYLCLIIHSHNLF